MREFSPTLAARVPYTYSLVDEFLVVLMVKVEFDPLFSNQHVTAGLCTAYGGILYVHARAALSQWTWQMPPLQLVKGVSCYLIFLASTLQVLHTVHRVRTAVVCQEKMSLICLNAAPEEDRL